MFVESGFFLRIVWYGKNIEIIFSFLSKKHFLKNLTKIWFITSRQSKCVNVASKLEIRYLYYFGPSEEVKVEATWTNMNLVYMGCKINFHAKEARNFVKLFSLTFLSIIEEITKKLVVLVFCVIWQICGHFVTDENYTWKKKRFYENRWNGT